jgi:hypothetical protein
MTTTPERRWFRWSLRTMFVLLTGAAIGLGLVERERRDKVARTTMLRDLEDRRAITAWETANDTGNVREMRMIEVQTAKLSPGEIEQVRATFPEAKIVER